MRANQYLAVSTTATGRFLRIQKVGTGILSLADVRVYGANIAEGKLASQSSTYSGAAVA